MTSSSSFPSRSVIRYAFVTVLLLLSVVAALGG